jgi:DNA topoisomerase I
VPGASGHELFHYSDGNGRVRRVSSGDVNLFLREIAGHSPSAKEFRTWAGTVLAARILAALRHQTAEQCKRNGVEAVKQVSSRLGNTPAVCRRCYIHPVVLDAYARDQLRSVMPRPRLVKAGTGLDVDERAVLDLISKPPPVARRKAA